MIGSAFYRALRHRKRTALNALTRIDHGILVSGFGNRKPLQGHAQTRLVHHGEHGAQALWASPMR